MSGEIKVEGMAQLDRKLKKLVERATGPQVEAALLKAAVPLETAMKRTTAFADYTGYLRRSIGTKKGRRRPSPTVTVGAKAPHAHLVEFGTAERHHKSGKSTGIMPKRPFIRPAYDKSKREVVAVMRRELQRMTDARTL